MSLCSSEKESWISIVGYTMEVLVCVQMCGSFQNPGWTVGWNSGREKGVEGGPQVQWAVRCLTACWLLWLRAQDLGDPPWAALTTWCLLRL